MVVSHYYSFLEEILFLLLVFPFAGGTLFFHLLRIYGAEASWIDLNECISLINRKKFSMGVN